MIRQIVGLVVVCVVLLGGYYIWLNRGALPTLEVTPADTAQPASTPTPEQNAEAPPPPPNRIIREETVKTEAECKAIVEKTIEVFKMRDQKAVPIQPRAPIAGLPASPLILKRGGGWVSLACIPAEGGQFRYLQEKLTFEQSAVLKKTTPEAK
jgi:hypothetical protein